MHLRTDGTMCPVFIKFNLVAVLNVLRKKHTQILNIKTD